MKNNISKFLNTIGVALMIATILIVLPLSAPKLLGFHTYGVLTGSMTPTYQVGGVVYVKDASPSEISVGDVITFSLGSNTEYVMTHRVSAIEDSAFITKGDANASEDPEPVDFSRLIGKVVFYLPYVGNIAQGLDTGYGKGIVVLVFVLCIIIWVIAEILKKPEAKKVRVKKCGDFEKKGINLYTLLGLVLCLGAVIYISYILFGYNEANDTYDSLKSRIHADSGDADDKKNGRTGQNITDYGEYIPTYEDEVIINNLRDLQKDNPEVIGWIKFDNLPIDYPIMHTTDDSYYLTHMYDGKVNSAGSIFAEKNNATDFIDPHTIIYGHNMKNGSMFGSLKQYKQKNIYNDNRCFNIYKDGELYRYVIFAYYDTPELSDVYNIAFVHDEEFGDFLNTMKRRSYYDTDIEVTKDDTVVTLSTCSAESYRFVVNAKLIHIYKWE